MESPHSMETSGFWESREDESHLEENTAKGCQETHLHWDEVSPIALLRIRAAPRSGIQWSPYEAEHARPFQAMIGVGGMYVNQEIKVKNCVQHLSQTLAMINDLACIRDLCTTSPLQPFEPTGKVLLKTWKAGSPESWIEEKRMGLWDI